MCSLSIKLITTIFTFAAAQITAPLYSACGPSLGCAAPGICQASVCIPNTALLTAPTALIPAPPPGYIPHPVAPVPVPVVSEGIAPVVAAQPPPYSCSPACLGAAFCIGGSCQCSSPSVVYNPVVGCAAIPVAPIPVAPVPVVAGRLIPQALPGSTCEPGVECTGGSVCSLGVCLCPPELVQEGTVCVSRTIYGVIPPPAVVLPTPIVPTIPVALGASCSPLATAPCVTGAICSAGICQCSPMYASFAGGCVLRK